MQVVRETLLQPASGPIFRLGNFKRRASSLSRDLQIANCELISGKRLLRNGGTVIADNYFDVAAVVNLIRQLSKVALRSDCN